uniref:Uncharacterized protein n=1 Tax=Rhizophora mucronata TaxID=61149 RepID=A0A2P2PI99_RHIMU
MLSLLWLYLPHVSLIDPLHDTLLKIFSHFLTY